jgi:tetratricopeptide (TPR) repeat protein
VADSSIQQAAGQLRVNARLLASSGEMVWAADFSGTLDRVFDLQKQLAEGFVASLKLRVQPTDQRRVGVRTTANVDALAEYWRGRTLLETGDVSSLESAMAAFESAVKKDPKFAEAFAGRGEAAWALYLLTKDPRWTDQAVTASETALELEPTLPRVWLILALVHNGTGQPERALEDLAQAETQLPNSDDLHRQRGTVLESLGRTDEALAAYQRAIELRPNYWRNHQRLGTLLYRLGRLDEAIASYTRITELQPENATGFQGLGTVQHVAGRLDAAQSNYQRAIALAPTPTAYSNLGVILHWQGRYREAIAEYEKALELMPERAARSHRLRRNLGDAWAKLGDMARARQFWGIAASLAEQELAVNSRDTGALADLAMYRAKLGEVGVARQRVAEALALAPDDADVHYSEAVVDALSARPQEAWAALRRSLELGTGLTVVEHDDDLESVRRLPDYVAWMRERAVAATPSARP